MTWDFFKDKKMPTPHYSRDFPQPLDSVSVLPFRHRPCPIKSDYKMCKQLTEQLKEDFESRIQMVEWELDDIVEEVLKPKR